MTLLEWQIATVRDIRPETTKVKSFTFALPQWMRHRAGQHYDLRLTAADGYRAQRSYSIASAPERALACSAVNSLHDHFAGTRTRPLISSCHFPRSTRGVGPAESTGKSVTRC